MSTILVVDDEAAVLNAFEGLLSDEGHQVLTARNAERALGMLHASRPDLVIMDVCMPGVSGLDALDQIKSAWPRLPVIVMTAQGTMQNAIEATKRGAFEYQLKPFEPAVMLDLVAKALRAVELIEREQPVAALADPAAGDALVGDSFAMQEVYKAIGRLARSDQPVLIRGEPGTGKKLLARVIHRNGRRSQQPLYTVRGSALGSSGKVVELLEAGASLGQVPRELPLGELPRLAGATLLLDEIGETTRETQHGLLSALGSDFSGAEPGRPPLLRLVATSSRDLERALTDKTLRPEFYHLLGTVTIWLPALRARSEDIRPLAEFLLTRIGRECEIERPQLAADALEVLSGHSWPGNVCELQACLRRSLMFAGSSVVQGEDIRRALENSAPPAQAGTADEDRIAELVRSFLERHGGNDAHEQLLQTVECRLLTEALRRTGGNRSRAALLLGISRPTLHAKLDKHNIKADRFGPA